MLNFARDELLLEKNTHNTSVNIIQMWNSRSSLFFISVFSFVGDFNARSLKLRAGLKLINLYLFYRDFRERAARSIHLER